MYFIYNSTSGTVVQSPPGRAGNSYQKQSVKLISKKECLRNYRTYLAMFCPISKCQNIDLSSHICTKYYTGYKGICYGDSGSPLVCNGIQYGIASAGISCGLNRMNFEVWVLVHLYKNWIRSNVPQSNFTELKSRAISTIFNNVKRLKQKIFVTVITLIYLLI